MYGNKENRYNKIIKLILIILACVILAGICFPFMGKALVADDEPEKSDMIVVLMGGAFDRMVGAAELYRQGYADKILMVESWLIGYEVLEEKGISIPRESDLAKSVGTQMGVPEDAFIILPGDATSTQEEAIIIRNYLQKQENIDSLLVVTSRYHSGRAKRIFVKVMDPLDRDIRISSCPVTYDGFDENKWWKDRDNIEVMVIEWVKMANFYLLEQFKI